MLREYVRDLQTLSGQTDEALIPSVALAVYTRPLSTEYPRADPARYFRSVIIAGEPIDAWQAVGAPLEDMYMKAAADPARPVWEQVGSGLFLRELAPLRDPQPNGVIVALLFSKDQRYPAFWAAFSDGRIERFHDPDESGWKQRVTHHDEDRERLGVSPLPDVAAWFAASRR